jgi:hypothetical protein
MVKRPEYQPLLNAKSVEVQEMARSRFDVPRWYLFSGCPEGTPPDRRKAFPRDSR